MRNFGLSICLSSLAAIVAVDGLSAQGTVERPAIPRVGAWQSIGPEGATVLGFAVDSSRPETVYALTPGRLFRSIDAGITWASHESVPGRFPTGIALSPGNDPVLFVTDSSEGLLRSDDGGKTWKRFELGGDIGESVTVDPSAPDRVWAAVSDGIWRSIDRGETWELSFGGHAVLVDRTDGNRVFAASTGGLFRSLDSGSTWQKVSDHTGATGLTQDPTDSRILFAWGPGVYSFGIGKTVDGGDTWVMTNNPLGSINGLAIDAQGVVYATNVAGLSLSRDGGSTWIPAVTESGPGAAALSDTSRPDTVYASVGLSVVRTRDGGTTFSSSRKGLVNPGRSEVGLDPRNPRHVLVGAPSAIGDAWPTVYSTRDGGSTWTESHPGYIEAFAVDPGDPERVYAAGGSGVFRSDDGGSTWARSSTGIDYPPTTILMDPVDPATLSVGACCGSRGSGGGVYRSHDSGATWFQSGFFPDPPEDRLWWVTSLAADAETRAIYAAGPRLGLRRSSLSLGFDGASFVAVDPLAPENVYAIGFYGGSAGLFRSGDRAASFNLLEGVAVDSVVPDPSLSGRLYATTTDRGVLRSTDHGVSWEPWNDGLRDLCVASLAIDAAGETLAAGTCTNGVYVRTVRPPRDSRVLLRHPH